MPLGRDIGFLPGDVDEKLNPWMQPIFDNLEFLFSSGSGKRRDRAASPSCSRADRSRSSRSPTSAGARLPHQYLIVDEAQNLTPHEVKTIITRCGEGTKIVLTGDPVQIDNPYVDSASNGLTDRGRSLQAARSSRGTSSSRRASAASSPSSRRTCSDRRMVTRATSPFSPSGPSSSLVWSEPLVEASNARRDAWMTTDCRKGRGGGLLRREGETVQGRGGFGGPGERRPEHCVSNVRVARGGPPHRDLTPEASSPMWDCIDASFCSKAAAVRAHDAVYGVARKRRSVRRSRRRRELEYAFSWCDLRGRRGAAKSSLSLRTQTRRLDEVIDRPCRSGSKFVNAAEEALVTKHH